MATASSPEPKIDLDRRAFWRGLLRNTISLVREARGLPQQNLDNLTGLPDAVVEEMIPVWREGYKIEVRDDGLYLPGKGSEGPALVHRFRDRERPVVEQFACGRNLRTIAGYVATQTGMPPADAFQMTRRVFVQLSQRGLCHPAACHLQE